MKGTADNLQSFAAVPQQIGRYVVEKHLGTGGMGEVYRCYDPSLKRSVAVKLIRWQDSSLIERFMREAQAQARVEHEHICRVYEVGVASGRHFIAMQYIEGSTLKEASADMRLEEKVRIMRQIAEAVHAAHRTGLIHRDLKPTNIMVEYSRENGWKPHVMDFGLAREAESAGLTLTGMVVGTPHYMAPEQARGDIHNLDRRTDVYALGATLYELFSGTTPFGGSSSVDVILKLLQDDPTPLRIRSPQIPEDLEIITMKCLEKEPRDRYDSARALAEDLQRYLEAEPIQGRRVSVASRIIRKAKKHKALFGAGAAAFLLICFLAGLAIHTRINSAKQARLAQRFGEEVERVEAILKQGALAPLHDTRYERSAVRSRMQWIMNEVKTAGPETCGPGYYALGKGALALGEYSAAEKYFDHSWNRCNFHEPRVAHSYGMTLAMRYREERTAAERKTNPVEREARLKEIDRAYRDPALKYLSQSHSEAADSQAYVKALLLYLQGQYAPALAETAKSSASWRYEAAGLEGSIHQTLGNARRDTGNYSAAQKHYLQSEASFNKAIRIGESDPANYEGLCALAASVMEMQVYQTGESPDAWGKRAITACDNALKANPESSRAWMLKSRVYIRIAEYEDGNGIDSAPALKRAIESGKKSLQFQPVEPTAYWTLGLAYMNLAEYEFYNGRDPNQILDDSIATFTEGTRVNPNDPACYNSMGNALSIRADDLEQHGKDPSAAYQKAIASFNKAIAIQPRHPYAYNNLGIVYTDQAGLLTSAGRNPSEPVQKAIASFKKAIEINPKNAYAHNNLGNAYMEQANWESINGRDPRDASQLAIESFARCLEINPNYSFALHNSAIAFLSGAEYEFVAGLNPEGSLRNAMKFGERAIQVNPDYAAALSNLGDVYRLYGRWEIQNQRAPQIWHDRARKLLQQSIQLSPDFHEAYNHMAETEVQEGQWQLHRNQNPEAKWNLAEEYFQKGLRIKSDSVESYDGLTRLQRHRALYFLKKNAPPETITAIIQSGVSFADRSRALQDSAVMKAEKAAILLIRAQLISDPGQRTVILNEASAMIEDAARQNPLLRKPFSQQLLAKQISTGRLIP